MLTTQKVSRNFLGLVSPIDLHFAWFWAYFIQPHFKKLLNYFAVYGRIFRRMSKIWPTSGIADWHRICFSSRWTLNDVFVSCLQSFLSLIGLPVRWQLFFPCFQFEMAMLGTCIEIRYPNQIQVVCLFETYFRTWYDRTQRPHCAGCSSHGQNKGFPLSKPTHFPNIANKFQFFSFVTFVCFVVQNQLILQRHFSS